jgi:NAD(P)-dependent dehydrogenase (short-subunit alcohol dehydrogenase family)
MAEGNVALVTGASSGIGEASARLLAQEGFRTFGTSRSPDAEGPRNVTMLQLDVTDDTSVRACVSEVLKQAGRIDVLVNNAGFGIFGAGEETSLDEAHAIFEVNVFGALRMSQAVLPGMRERGSGTIINIASGAGIVGVPFEALYSATKFALRGMTESMRIELKPFGVHVCTVDPGFTKTNFKEAGRLPDEPIAAYDDSREAFLHEAQKHFADGLDPKDVARAVVHAATADPPAVHDAVGSDTLQAELGRRFAPWGMLQSIVASKFGQ